MGKTTNRGAKHRISKQVGRVHFDDLSGHDFERLVFAFAVRSGWPNAEWAGQVGGDRGRDVWCPGNKKPASVFLCANYKTLTFAKVSSDLQRLASNGPKSVDVFVVAGGLVSDRLRGKIMAEATRLGFLSVVVWSAVEFEERLRITAPDLLKRFFEGEAFPEDAEELRQAILALPTVGTSGAGLSREATRLLEAMSGAAEGRMLRSKSHSGYGISISDKEFVPDTMEHRVEARWDRAIRELLDRGLIEEDGPSGDIFGVTDSGYQFVEASPGAQGAAVAGFQQVKMGNPAQFFRGLAELIPEGPFEEGPVAAEIPLRGFASLRLFPSEQAPALKSALAAKYLATGGHLRPMGATLSGFSWGRNGNGAIVYSRPVEGKLTNFTELFLSSEICGIDMRVVHKIHQATGVGRGVVHLLNAYEFELSFALALENYIKFARASLKQAGPLQFEAGLYGVKGTLLGFRLRSTGKALDDEFIWAGTITTAEVEPADVLRPFFEQVWEGYGISRPPEAEQQLAKSLSG
jgi:hypothetical protein